MVTLIKDEQRSVGEEDGGVPVASVAATTTNPSSDNMMAFKSPTSEVTKQSAAHSLANLFSTDSEGGKNNSMQDDLVADLMGVQSIATESFENVPVALRGGGGDAPTRRSSRRSAAAAAATSEEEPAAKKAKTEEDEVPVAEEVAMAEVPLPEPEPIAAPVEEEDSKPSAVAAPTPQRAAGASVLASLSGSQPKTESEVADAVADLKPPALPPIAEVATEAGVQVQHDYMMQSLVHASKVTSPLPTPGKGRKPPPGAVPVPPPVAMAHGAPPLPGIPGAPPMIPPPGAIMPPPPAPPAPPASTKSRKEKSLGVLCAAFMDLFKNCPPNRDNNGTVIEICQIAEHLQVKRRRIYDVINILEAIDIVCRVKKNTYRWHGKDGLPQFFAKLQQEGIQERANLHAAQAAAGGDAVALAAVTAASAAKTKGMAQTCQKLLQLFLVSGRTEIALNDAAEDILGPVSGEEANQQRAMKTKVRRMYDIANVLTSIGVLNKENVGSTSLQNKPSFRWVYPILPGDMATYLNTTVSVPLSNELMAPVQVPHVPQPHVLQPQVPVAAPEPVAQPLPPPEVAAPTDAELAAGVAAAELAVAAEQEQAAAQPAVAAPAGEQVQI